MKYLIMHGSFGSPEENWFRWLEKELHLLEHEVILEQFPVDSWEEVEKVGQANINSYQSVQSLVSWENFFVEKILPQIIGKEIGFVGHSIAPLFILHMMQKYDLRFEKAIFVAPFFELENLPDLWQFEPVASTFFSSDFDFEKIKRQIGKSYVVYGDDDPYVPVSQPRLFAEKLDSEIHLVQNGKHCGSNFKEFPLLLNLIK